MEGGRPGADTHGTHGADGTEEPSGGTDGGTGPGTEEVSSSSEEEHWIHGACGCPDSELGWVGAISGKRTMSYNSIIIHPTSFARASVRLDGRIEDVVSLTQVDHVRKNKESICVMETGGNSEPRVSRGKHTVRVPFGFAKVKGPKKHHIEDFHVARIQEVDNQEVGLFAVMDGHSGPAVAVYLTGNLFEVITKHPEFWKDPKKAIVEAYHETDERILGMGSTDMKLRVGSTATTALLLNNGRRLIVANVGDSRAVLSRGGRAVDLSVDHEPQKPHEQQMVESKGGTVTRSIASGVYRVDHRLAMSRAFGDYDLKEHLSVQPDIWDEELSAEDDFFVIASDGVWHVLSSQEVVDYVRSTAGSAEEVAQAVVSAALLRHSKDDIACLVVFL